MVGKQDLHDALAAALLPLGIDIDLGLGQIQGGVRTGIVGLPEEGLDVGLVPLEVADAQGGLGAEGGEQVLELGADGGGTGGGHDGGDLLPGAAVGDLHSGLIVGDNRGHIIADEVH